MKKVKITVHGIPRKEWDGLLRALRNKAGLVTRFVEVPSLIEGSCPSHNQIARVLREKGYRYEQSGGVGTVRFEATYLKK